MDGFQDADDDAPSSQETVMTYEVPALFQDLDGKPDKPLLSPIEYIFVYEKRSDGRWGCIDCRPVAELHDEMDLLREFGAGTYMLQGRGADRRNVLRAASRTVGRAEPKGTRQAVAAPAPAIPSVPNIPISALSRDAVVAAITTLGGLVLSYLEKAAARATQERQQEADRQRLFVQGMKTQSDETLKVITQLTQARIGDLEAIIRGSSSKGSGGLTMDTLADVAGFIDTVREGGGTEQSSEDRIAELLTAMLQGAKQGQEDPVRRNGAPVAAE